MTVKSLRKVRKHIVKKKGEIRALHENSRDSQRLRRATAREDKLSTVAASRAKQAQPILQRVAFFQERASSLDDGGPASQPTVHEFIQEYLHRSDAEMKQLKAARRRGQPASTRQDLLAHQQDREQKEYASGLWMPDLEDRENVSMLLEWGGDAATLASLSFCRVSEGGGKRAAKYPPSHDH